MLAQNAPRRPALLPGSVVEALLEEFSSENAMRHLAMISQHSRLPGSPGFHRAAEYVAEQAKAAGLEQVELHRLPGTDVGWEAEEAVLEMVAPEKRKLADLRDVPTLLVQRSHDADVTAELLDVGAGRTPTEYEGKEVAGQLVLTSSHPNAAFNEAIVKRKAAGIVSYYRPSFHGLMIPENATAWGSIPWKEAGLAFMVTPAVGESLRRRLAAGEKVRLRGRARVTAVENAGVEMVTGLLRGSGLPDQEILFSAHLDHPRQAANDNASGSAALLEIARTLTALRRAGRLPALRRTVRFWWVTEFQTTQAFIFKDPAAGQRLIADFNLDSVGGDRLAHNDYVVQATFRVAPSFLNALVDNFAQHAARDLAPVAQSPSPLFVAPGGTRQPFTFQTWRDEDERPVTDSFAFVGLGIPGINVMAPSFDLIHSSADALDRIDPTQLKRGAWLALAPAVFLATMKEEDAGALADAVFSYGASEAAHQMEKALRAADAAGADRIRDAFLYWRECLDAVRPLAEGSAPALGRLNRLRGAVDRQAAAQEELLPPRALPEERRLTSTIPAVTSSLGQQDQRVWDYAANTYAEWYVKHLVDGRRSLLDIYRAVHAMYPVYTVAEMEKYLAGMTQAGIVRMQPR